jgi:thiol-disulfide isomerase/thioredoxin
MSRRNIGALALILACVIPACPQTPDLPEAVRLLRQVSQRYAEARNYYIKAIETDTYSGEFDGGWTKTILIASESGRRFHFEVEASTGSAIAIGDGNTIWLRHAGDRVYASISESDQELNNTIRTLNQDAQIRQSKRLRTSLVNLTRNVTEANFLPDQSFARGDRLVRSRVILIREGERESTGLDASTEKTVWIDEDGEKILKIVERKVVQAVSARGAKDIEMTTTFNTIFDDPPDCLFTADVLDETPDGPAPLRPNIVNPLSLVGRKLPDLRFKSTEGAAVTLNSLAGRPLLIDFWATWCSPCVAALPELAEIYEVTRGKGLTFLAVDQDNEPGKGSSFLQKKGYTWPDFTDPDAEVHKQLGYEGLPHVVLVDSTGTIVYDGTGENANELRARIAKLGPEFKSLARGSGPCAIPR